MLLIKFLFFLLVIILGTILSIMDTRKYLKEHRNLIITHTTTVIGLCKNICLKHSDKTGAEIAEILAEHEAKETAKVQN